MAATNDTMQNFESTGRQGGNRAQSLGEQTSKVAEDVRELGNLAVSGATDALRTVKERGNEAIEKAKERGQQVLEKGKERAGQAREGFELYVMENPFKSVLIAAGIGALIGFSMRGSRNNGN
jgi:ElaB/YqjD/DUF883 family membrane-anchored ribosome-binding protein